MTNNKEEELRDKINGGEEAASIGAVSAIKLPPFWAKKVPLWFTQVEATFAVNRITKDDIKFMHVISELSPQYLEEVEDILSDLPENKKYETIKEALIKRLSDSDSAKVRKLLENEELGDRTPTQFWRHLKKLSNSSVTDDFLVEMWKTRLPIKTQQVLAAITEKDGNKLAEIADRIHDIPNTERRRIATVAEPPSKSEESIPKTTLEKLYEEMLATRLMVNAVLEQRDQRQGRSRSRSRSTARNRSGSRRRYDTCWYHYRFGEKCLPEKCVPPCKYKTKSEN